MNESPLIRFINRRELESLTPAYYKLRHGLFESH